jgi:hypothetical protein
MGNWHLSIEGIGAHHNKLEPGQMTFNVDTMAKMFIEDLKARGHRVLRATITYGAADQLDPEKEMELRNPYKPISNG